MNFILVKASHWDNNTNVSSQTLNAFEQTTDLVVVLLFQCFLFYCDSLLSSCVFCILPSIPVFPAFFYSLDDLHLRLVVSSGLTCAPLACLHKQSLFLAVCVWSLFLLALHLWVIMVVRT